MLNIAKEYHRSGTYKQKTLVSRVGKQPDSHTWVLSEDTQIDGEGKLIPFDKQEYYWCALTS